MRRQIATLSSVPWCLTGPSPAFHPSMSDVMFVVREFGFPKKRHSNQYAFARLVPQPDAKAKRAPLIKFAAQRVKRHVRRGNLRRTP